MFANPPEQSAPKPTDPNVRYFGPGIHRAGKIVLKSNETVYIAGGAVVHATIEATEQSNLRSPRPRYPRCQHVRAPDQDEVRPRSSNPSPGERRERYLALDGGVYGGAITLLGCENVCIEGIVIRDPDVWTLVPVGCRRVRAANLKLIGLWRYNSDGIDIVNSRDVTIDGCFIRSFDDSICIKGRQAGEYWHGYAADTHPVRNVTVSNCVIWNDWGTALKLDELAAPEIAHVLFQDCDIIRTCSCAIRIGAVIRPADHS